MSAHYEGKVVVITGGGGGIGKAAARRFLEEGADVVLSGTRIAVLEAAQAELDPAGARTAAARRADHHPRGRPGADRRRRRALRRRRRARQQHRHLPPRAVPGADGGAARGGARLDPAPDLLGRPGRRGGDGRARRRRDRQRRLDVGRRRDRHDADERLLRRAGRPPRAGQEPRGRARGRAHQGQHGRAGVRRDAGLRALPRPRRRPRPCSTPSTASTRSAAAGSPSDVVEAILFLAGDDAGWITGTTLPVDGGVLAGRSPAVQPVAA